MSPVATLSFLRNSFYKSLTFSIKKVENFLE